MFDDTYRLVVDWDNGGLKPECAEDFNSVYETIEYHCKKKYGQYIPALRPDFGEFWIRLSRWLHNVQDDAQRRVLLEFVPYIIFLGREEILKLGHVAFREVVMRWLVDILDIRFDTSGVDEQMREELTRHTWYCPLTDSMSISDFCHANGLGGVEYRPEFRALAEFTEAGTIANFMNCNKDGQMNPQPLRRIVILEDFVGRGTQFEGAIRFAASLGADKHVLFVPLVICPEGARNARALANQLSNVTFEPVLELTEDLFINDMSDLKDRSFDRLVRDVVLATFPLVEGDGSASPLPYGPYGFGRTGARIVTYSNTPANTLPILQHQSNSWSALFPREPRLR